MTSTVLILLFLAIIAASCFACYLASDAVILMIQNFGMTRTKIAFGGLALIVVGVSLFATWWYASSSRHQGQNIETAAIAAPAQTAAGAQAGDLNLLVDRLDARLQREPQDAQGLALFARTTFELRRYPAAAKAYAKAAAALPDDATLQIEWADAEYMANNQQWTPVALAAIARAFKLAPENPEVLWLAGKERFESKDYAQAVIHWEALARGVVPGSDQARDLKTSLVEARALRDGKDPAAALANAGVSASPLPQSVSVEKVTSSKESLAAELKAVLTAMDTQAVPAQSVRQASAITGVVSLDTNLKQRVAPDDNVFIFARNADTAQAGMPLAVLRHRVSELPVRFDLSDNNAMSPAAKLSSASKVIITARLSKSGDARPQTGDLEGVSAPVTLGTENLGIVINRAR
jgi:cytochrome c-type biogenesis protein CcmH